MGLFNFFKKKDKNAEHRIGGMEDFMTLIRVYYQASMAANIGITNINVARPCNLQAHSESAYTEQQTGYW